MNRKNEESKNLSRIVFYRDRRDHQPVVEYMEKIAKSNGKDARVNLTKIRDYIEALDKYGTSLGEPYMKHLDGDIWELRPIRNRILFTALIDGKYVLLHAFLKKTQKTPKEEIEKAKKEMEDYIQRRDL